VITNYQLFEHVSNRKLMSYHSNKIDKKIKSFFDKFNYTYSSNIYDMSEKYYIYIYMK